MYYGPDRELPLLDAEDIHYQENEHGYDILALIKSALYHLVALSDWTGYIEADICGMTPSPWPKPGRY
jgi:hypothetical protein